MDVTKPTISSKIIQRLTDLTNNTTVDDEIMGKLRDNNLFTQTQVRKLLEMVPTRAPHELWHILTTKLNAKTIDGAIGAFSDCQQLNVVEILEEIRATCSGMQLSPILQNPTQSGQFVQKMSAPPAQPHRDEDHPARDLQGIVSRIEEQMAKMHPRPDLPLAEFFRPHVGELYAATAEEDVIDRLIQKLYEKKVLDDVEEFKRMSLREQCQKIYNVIARKRALKTLLDALEESNNSHIIKLMEGWLPRQDLPQPPKTLNSVAYDRASNVEPKMQKPTSENDEIPQLDGTPRGGSVAANYFREVYAVNKDHYRGLALIVNVWNYPNKNENRIGSEEDVQSLQKVLNNCNIAQMLVIDPISSGSRNTAPERVLSDVIPHFQKQFDDQEWNADCCFVFVMAHGEDGSNDCIVLSDGGIFSVWTELVEKFSDNAHQIKRLKEIPKIFVFNYCRGIKVMGPTRDAYSGLNPSSNDVQNQSSPEWTEMLICYATVQGYAAVRQGGRRGTWFIQILCEAMQRYADKYDFVTILDIVSDTIKKVEDKKKNGKVWKQMPAYYNIGFDKLFFLKPVAQQPCKTCLTCQGFRFNP